MAPTTRSPIGVPIAENRLTSAAIDAQDVLIRPGQGRSRYALQEVELGVGRPDLVIATAAPAALRSRAARGLRLDNLTEARVLAAAHTGGQSGVSPSHERAVKARLRQGGWIDAHGRSTEARPVVSEALIVEAKVKDWRVGIGQIVRNRWAYSSGALLLPAETQARVPRRTIRHNGVGLLLLENGQLRWQIRPKRKPLSWLASAWITELLLRDLDSARGLPPA